MLCLTTSRQERTEAGTKEDMIENCAFWFIDLFPHNQLLFLHSPGLPVLGMALLPVG